MGVKREVGAAEQVRIMSDTYELPCVTVASGHWQDGDRVKSRDMRDLANVWAEIRVLAENFDFNSRLNQ
jgi:hypothetical protein